jgi:hypothetical protein
MTKEAAPKSMAKLRKIARERALRIILKGKAPFVIAIQPDDVHFLDKFTHETAFYIEELENRIGEELTDYWESREHATRILTDLLIQGEQHG